MLGPQIDSERRLNIKAIQQMLVLCCCYQVCSMAQMHIKIYSSALIIQSNISWYCIHHGGDWGRNWMNSQKIPQSIERELEEINGAGVIRYFHPLYSHPGVKISYDIFTPGLNYRYDIFTPLRYFHPLPIKAIYDRHIIHNCWGAFSIYV